MVANVVIMDNGLALMAQFLHQNGNGYTKWEPVGNKQRFTLPAWHQLTLTGMTIPFRLSIWH